MPNLGGYAVCEEIRRADQDLPIVFLTAKDSDVDELRGLSSGADDYIPKTAAQQIKLARIAAVLRRAGAASPPAAFMFGRCRVDAAQMRMSPPDGSECDLSPRELAIMRYFRDHPGEVVSRDFLLTRFWGSWAHEMQIDRVVLPHGMANQTVNYSAMTIYFNTKFSGQEGRTNLTSPAMLRWGEVVLNRAEARAKLGDNKGAFDDVNIIRHRAGLTGDADFTEANYQTRGYKDALEVVLDERRMELCFEGHRYFDVFRNRKDMDRRYVGFHEFGFIKHDDPRIALLIPLDEINSSHIQQNR